MIKIFSVIYMLISLSSCAQIDDKDAHLTFSKWRTDTLKKLNANMNGSEHYIRHNYSDSSISFLEIHLLGNDTDFFEVLTHYKKEINPRMLDGITDNSILRVLDLLKEFAEMPDRPFVLEFVNVTTYYPSEISTYPYGFSEDIKGINLETYENRVFHYQYNRGSLTSKTEVINRQERLRKAP